MKYKLFILFLLLFFYKGYAQHDVLRFKRLTTLQGLSQSWTRCIYQNDIGYLWFGTADGLNRYDGYNFKVYIPKSGDKSAIGSMVINQISNKSKNELWICTNNGIYVYNRLTDDFHLFSYLKDVEVQCMLEDSQHDTWFGTSKGLYRLNLADSTIKTYLHDKQDPSSISQNRIRCIFQDSHKNIWVGTESGLNLYNPANENFIRYVKSLKPESLIGDSIWSILEDKHGRLWIGVAQAGVELFTNFKERPKEGHFHQVVKGSPLCLLLDKENRLWIGNGTGKGLNIIDLNNFGLKTQPKIYHYEQQPDNDESLSDNSIESLYMDRLGDIWVGTYGGGVNYFSERAKKFENHKITSDTKTTISSNLVNAFYEDENYVWVGTERGLDRLDKKTKVFKHFYHNQKDKTSIGANAIYKFYKDSRGNLWIGSWHGGLGLYNPRSESFNNYIPSKKAGSLNNPNVFAICEDKKGYLWVGTIGGGLNRFDYKTEKFTHFTHNDADPHSLHGNSVNCVYQTSDGKLFISNYEALDIFDEKNNGFIHFIHDYNNPKSISGGYILSVFEDSKKHIWIATSSGLNLFNSTDNTFTLYNTAQGLPNNTIQGIMEDKKGNLWLSTNKGLAVFINGSNIPTEPRFRIYNKDDGLPANEFTIRAAYQNKSGRMYFGTSQGYTCFHPDIIVDNKIPPVVILTEFNLLKTSDEQIDKRITQKKQINLIEEIELNYNESNFYITYAALNYLNTEKNQYKYRLEGYETGWHIAGTQRTATYTNIQPGKYTFMVLGSNNDGVWSPAPKKLRIVVHSPWWGTLIFKLSVVILIILLIYGFIKLRLKILEKQKRILEKTVIKRTNELEEMNTVLEERQEEISIQNEELSRHRNNLELLIEERTAELEAAKTKAEESDRLKSAFLANMSHEIRTPMNAIIGFSSLLSDKTYSEEEKLRFIEIINSSGESLLVLIDDIIDISLIEANQIVTYNSSFDATKVLTDLESYYKLKNNKGIEIKFVNDPKQELHLNTDFVRFRQIFNNLINNAIKFTDEGYIHFGYEVKEHEYQFFVNDTGIGIDEKDQETIFQHFYKIEKESNRLYRGAGIGLAICRKLVEKMGGRIWVESKINVGSSFNFTLPKIKEGTVTDSGNKPHIQNDNLTNLSVLIAEDEPANYELLAKILTPKGAILHWAKNGEEAVDYLKNNNWPEDTIVLMDIKMPLMDGYEATRIIKNANNNIRVIAITAYAQMIDKQKILHHGFDDYISKPVNKELLLSKIIKLKKELS